MCNAFPMFKGLNITCEVYILAFYFYNSGGLRVFNHFLRLISFLFCYFLIFLRIFSLVIFLNFFLNFLKKQALVSYKIFLIKKNKCNSYRDIIKLNWEHRYKKFSDIVYSWNNRVLETLSQRIEVLRMFGLSRVYYIASILPLGTTMAKKFESLMGKFIWNFSGKLLRISMEDLKNPKLSGGLKLPCISNMASALLTSQCVRLIRSGDSKTLRHLEFWLGDLLGVLSTNYTTGSVVIDTPTYYEKIGVHLTDLMILDALNASNVSSIRNKDIYQVFMSDLGPPK